MTYVMTADVGKWITETGFIPEQESAPNFWHEVRTSHPEDYEEVDQEEKDKREKEWQEAHPQPEPNGEEVSSI